MNLDHIQAGHDSVNQILGMEKKAVGPILSKAPALLRRIGGGIKRFAIGEPKRFMKEVREGKVWSPGSTVRSMFEFPSFKTNPLSATAHGAFLVGLPAYEGYHIMTDPEGQKAERMGGMLGGTALGWAAFGPGGLLASIPAGMIGEAVGGLAGKGVGKVVGEKPPAPPTYQATYPGRALSPARIRAALGDNPLANVHQWEQGHARHYQGASPGQLTRRVF
jgi:hypothetical protein